MKPDITRNKIKELGGAKYCQSLNIKFDYNVKLIGEFLGCTANYVRLIFNEYGVYKTRTKFGRGIIQSKLKAIGGKSEIKKALESYGDICSMAHALGVTGGGLSFALRRDYNIDTSEYSQVARQSKSYRNLTAYIPKSRKPHKKVIIKNRDMAKIRKQAKEADEYRSCFMSEHALNKPMEIMGKAV
jgi:hypothetical protein